MARAICTGFVTHHPMDIYANEFVAREQTAKVQPDMHSYGTFVVRMEGVRCEKHFAVSLRVGTTVIMGMLLGWALGWAFVHVFLRVFSPKFAMLYVASVCCVVCLVVCLVVLGTHCHAPASATWPCAQECTHISKHALSSCANETHMALIAPWN